MIIILTGLMGSGKSSTGKALAKLLGYSFIDLDKQIEATSGISVAEIFSQHGEPYFRNLESETLTEVLHNPNENIVLALGGGTFVASENIQLCRQNSIVVWLNMSLSVIENRLRSGINNRPLLKNTHVRETLEKLLDNRQSSYAQAHIEIKLDKNYPISYMAELILNTINDYTAGKLHG
ncbi:MAG: shikimate kinase [Alphaproteobacteria bacterium]|jgi:shikimate kinase|nr:shikimate kinase [Alphaproteobacteria bacterium]